MTLPDGNRISDEAMLLSLADSIEQDPTTGPGSASALSLAEISDKLDRLYARLGERTPLG